MAGVNVTRPQSASHSKLVIGLDCDGVLASGQELWAALFAAFPDCIPNSYASLTSYDWPRITPETTELCLRLSADAEFTRQFSAIPYMAWAIRTLYQSGWEIHIITARPPEVHQATLDWLRAQRVGRFVRAVHCREDKAPLAQELGCCVFVEDNLRAAETLGALGLRSYLLDASYNQAPLQHSIRISGWRALIADLTTYQRTLQPRLVPALARTPLRRAQKRSLHRRPNPLLSHTAEPQPAA